jgi:hypothetical protein
MRFFVGCEPEDFTLPYLIATGEALRVPLDSTGNELRRHEKLFS